MRENTMILGVGIDLVDIRRIQKMLDRYGDLFIERFFSPQEFAPSFGNKAAHYAKRFAAKEAFIKAMGGIRHISFKDIGIVKKDTGCPTLVITPLLAKKLWQEDVPHISVSLTDEWPYAQAMVVLSSEHPEE